MASAVAEPSGTICRSRGEPVVQRTGWPFSSAKSRHIGHRFSSSMAFRVARTKPVTFSRHELNIFFRFMAGVRQECFAGFGQALPGPANRYNGPLYHRIHQGMPGGAAETGAVVREPARAPSVTTASRAAGSARASRFLLQL